MEVKLAVLADAANISKEGKLNVLGVFTQVNATTFPLVWPSMALVIGVEGDVSEAEETHQLTVRIVDEDGNQMVELEGTLGLRKPPDMALPATGGIILNLRGTQFDKAGIYTFDILIDGRYEDAIPLHVLKKQG